MKKFNTKDRGAPKSAGPVAIATFATTVNPVLRLTWGHKLATGLTHRRQKRD